MNKIILLFTLILSNCCLMIDEDKLPSLSNPNDAMLWSHNAITYDKSVGSHWNNPDKILEVGRGVCIDYCILMHYALRNAGISSEIITLSDRTHSIIRCDNNYYDPTNPHISWDNPNIQYVYNSCQIDFMIATGK